MGSGLDGGGAYCLLERFEGRLRFGINCFTCDKMDDREQLGGELPRVHVEDDTRLNRCTRRMPRQSLPMMPQQCEHSSSRIQPATQESSRSLRLSGQQICFIDSQQVEGCHTQTAVKCTRVFAGGNRSVLTSGATNGLGRGGRKGIMLKQDAV